LSYAACSSGVRLLGFFFAIFVLHQSADLRDVVAEIHEQAHDSRDVTVRNRRLHDTIFAATQSLRKMSATDAALRAFSLLTDGKGDFMHWVWLIIVGALVGALGRLFHPGSDPMGWIVTILIGIASLVVAGLIFSSGLLQFIVGIVVAVILVALVGRFFGERRRGALT